MGQIRGTGASISTWARRWATINHRGRHQRQSKVRRKGYPPVSKTFETKADARPWARLVESEMDEGAFVSREEAERTTLAEALARYAAEVTPRKKCARQERHRIGRLEKHGLARRLPESGRTGAVASPPSAVHDLLGLGSGRRAERGSAREGVIGGV